MTTHTGAREANIATTELHWAGFVLRPLTQDDAPAFTAAVQESANTISRWMGWANEGFTQAEALDWIAACDAGRANGSSHEFGIFRNELLIGGAGLNQLNTRHAFCNLGYWVRSSAQGQGAATAAVALLARHAFHTLHLSRVEIIVADGNLASMAVARKSGAVHECLARKRLLLRGQPVAAHVFSLVAEDLQTDLRTSPSVPPPAHPA